MGVGKIERYGNDYLKKIQEKIKIHDFLPRFNQ